MTIFEAYNTTKQKLQKAGIEDFVFEAKQIIKHITGLNATQILTEYQKKLTAFQENNLTALLRQREIRYPLQYIFGEWEFYGRPFYVGPGVLVPRADSETVVEACLEYLQHIKEPKILDLCTGSGCIGITLALEKYDSEVSLLEKYDEAYRYAEKNIVRNEAVNTAIYKGDIFLGDLSDSKYDLIVSNPPYIPENEMKDISPEAEFEPVNALFANDNGLEFYKAVCENYKNSLKPNGMLCFEVGIGKADAVSQILRDNGFAKITVKKDLNSVDRAVWGFKA